ncbi:MAG: DUF1573 domain-containing protein [Candidatus Kapabacteria bacterium]|nr:DUF1573 domain-containing protein [Candidatus Kapabacteria bacterium]
MVKYAIIASALLIGVLSLRAQDVMKVPETQDWGTIRLPKGLFVEAELPIENVAKNGMLKILEVRPGCGCTKTDPDKTDLQPGETAKVKIKLNLTSSQGGQIVKTVTIRALHGADTLVKIVYLKVNLDRVLVIGPSTFVSFNDAAVGAETTRLVTMDNPSGTSVTIGKVTLDGDVKTDLVEGAIIAAHTKRDVAVRLTPSKPGQVYGSLKFTANSSGYEEEFLLPAYGTVVKVAEK